MNYRADGFKKIDTILCPSKDHKCDILQWNWLQGKDRSWTLKAGWNLGAHCSFGGRITSWVGVPRTSEQSMQLSTWDSASSRYTPSFLLLLIVITAMHLPSIIHAVPGHGPRAGQCAVSQVVRTGLGRTGACPWPCKGISYETVQIFHPAVQLTHTSAFLRFVLREQFWI